LFECECLEAFGFDGFDCKRYLLAALAGAVVCVAVVVAVVTSCVGSRPQDTRIMGCGAVGAWQGRGVRGRGNLLTLTVIAGSVFIQGRRYVEQKSVVGAR